MPGKGHDTEPGAEEQEAESRAAGAPPTCGACDPVPESAERPPPPAAKCNGAHPCPAWKEPGTGALQACPSCQEAPRVSPASAQALVGMRRKRPQRNPEYPLRQPRPSPIPGAWPEPPVTYVAGPAAVVCAHRHRPGCGHGPGPGVEGVGEQDSQVGVAVPVVVVEPRAVDGFTGRPGHWERSRWAVGPGLPCIAGHASLALQNAPRPFCAGTPPNPDIHSARVSARPLTSPARW